METTIDKHQFKITVATAIVALLFIIVLSTQFATWKAEVIAKHNEFDDRISHVGEKIINMRIEIEHAEDKANGRDIEMATINVKLANIETILLEIKNDLKRQNN